jgi:hypothetical protein
MRRLVLKVVAGLGLIAEAFHNLTKRARFRAHRTPLAGPRPGAWLPG